MNKQNTVILLSALAVSSLSAALTTSTNFDGAGSLSGGANWDNGSPTNANPGLISGTTGTSWLGGAWTDVAVRQTGGEVVAAAGDSYNFAMRGGASAGTNTIYEIEDVANSAFAYKNLYIQGKLTMWSQNGGGHELNLLSGYASLGSLNAISNANSSMINIGNGKLDIGILDAANVSFNMLTGGAGEIVIGDRNGDKLNSMRLNFETGNVGSITILTNGGGLADYWGFFLDKGWASIDGVTVTDHAQFNIQNEGFATTISLIPEPGISSILAGLCTLAFALVRRRG